MTSIRLSYVVKAILLLALIIPCTSSAATKREMRGVWLATVWCLDWPGQRGDSPAVISAQKRQMREMLDSYEEQNFTTVFFQVRGMADAIYRSSLSPWSSFLSGSRDGDPGWDPLEFVVKECHSRGLECYAWVNPFRWSSGKEHDSRFDREWMRRGWLLSHGKYTVLNPGIEQVRDHIVDICRELVENYEIDGLVFDDYFYPNKIPETKEAQDYELWRETAPLMSIGDWRRANINKTIADIHTMISDTKPELRFGVSPAGVAGRSKEAAGKWGAECIDVKASDWQYSEIYSEPLAWLYQGTIDFISPQIYWSTTHETAPFEPIADWWSRRANDYGSHFYCSITLEAFGKKEDPALIDEVIRQIEINRRVAIEGNGGVILYGAKYLPKLNGSLRRELFTGKSISPEMRRGSGQTQWQQRPEAPGNVSIVNGVLRWTTSGRNVGLETCGAERYAVYAFPKNVKEEDIYSPDGDGIDGRWLRKIVYGTEMKVTDKDLHYAVTRLSGYSIESDPAFLR